MKKLYFILLSVAIALSLVSCNTENNHTSKNSTNQKSSYEKDGDYYYSNEKTKEIYYTVQFQTNGGEKIDAKTIKDGGQISTPPVTTRDGYLFEGWFVDQALTQGAVFPLVIENDTVIYAKWLRLCGTGSFVESYIDSSAFSTSGITYSLTPNGFDMERLQELNYRMKITVTYEVSYARNFDGWDIFYAGAPKYETYVTLDGETIISKEDQKPSTKPTEKNLEYTAKISDIKDKNIKLQFSSDNCQNIIYFTNISVKYECG